MDQDMIPILERVDEYDFYSPLWQYSNSQPKAPPPSPAPSSDQQLSTMNSLAPIPGWEFLPQKLSTASDTTVPSMVHDKYDTSSDEEYGGSEYGENHTQHSVTARSPEVIEWPAIDCDAESAASHHPTLPIELASGFQFGGYGSTASRKQRVYIESDYYGIATTTTEKVLAPKWPRPAAGTSTLQRTRDDDAAISQPFAGTFSVFPRVPSHARANASAGSDSHCREPFPILQMERSVFEDDDDVEARGRGRFGSLSHIRLPSRLGSGERGKTLKRRASSMLHGLLNCRRTQRT